MKFTIETGALRALLAAAKAAVGRSDTIVVINHVRIEVSGERIEIRATDLDKELTIYGSAQVGAPGTALIEHPALADWVKTLSDGSQVEIESVENGVVARCGRARRRLPTLDENDFPPSPAQSNPIRFEIAAADLARVLRTALPAVSTNETLYYLCGVHLVPRDGWLRGEATNGHLLSIVGMAVPLGAEEMPPTIVPTASARALLGLIDGAGTLAMAVTENRVVVDTDRWRFGTKLIEGTFPDIQRVVGSVEIDRTLSVSGPAFAAAVRRVASAAEIVGKNLRAIRLDMSARELRVSAGPDGFNESEDMVDATLDGEPSRMAFNSLYLRDLLETHKFDKLIIDASTSDKPVRLREDGAPECDCAVLMPMRA